MDAPGSDAPVYDPDLGFRSSPITVLCVDDEAMFLDFLRAALGDDDRLTVVTETTPEAALGRVGDADCVVSDYSMPSRDGLELLDDVRARDPDVPFLLVTSEPPSDVAEPLLSQPGTDYLRKTGEPAVIDLLKRRIRRMVDRRRLAGSARRSLAGIETTRDGIAVTRPDGTFQSVSRRYATRLGYDAEDLVGRSWREVYADDAVERFESSLFPAVEDARRWTGECTEHRKDGRTVTTQTSVIGLADGSLVFTAYADAEDEAD